MPDQTWTAVTTGGDRRAFGYDSDWTGGTDANVLPWTWRDFAITPYGSAVTMQVPAPGFFRAS